MNNLKMLLAPIAALALVAGCAALKPVVQGVVDLATAECTQLETQPQPEWVLFACSAVGPIGTVVETIAVSKAQAPAFAASHAPKAARK